MISFDLCISQRDDSIPHLCASFWKCTENYISESYYICILKWECSMKRCSVSPVRDMQVKTTGRYHLTPIRMTTIAKDTLGVCGLEYWQVGNSVHSWWDCKVAQALWNSMELPQKLKIELLHDPAIPLLGIYQKELKARSQKDICALIFITALFIINMNSQEEEAI